MARADGGEVSVVGGGEAVEADAFGGGDELGVDEADLGVLLEELGDADVVGRDEGLRLEIQA